MAKKKAATEEPTQSVDPRIPRPRLHKLRVSNFRCIGPDPVEIELDDIVVLVGPNNAGKSSILRAYEIVMKHGSAEGEMAIDDFPHGHVKPGQEPTIELETVVFEKSLPGEKWVRTDPQTNEMFVREKWTWSDPGAPKKVGWDVTTNAWHASEGPWGLPGVAQSKRPQAHRVGAFQKPEDQAAELVKLLSKAITDRVKELSSRRVTESGDEGPSQYEQLLGSIKTLRQAIAAEAQTAIADVQTSLAAMISEVFPGHAVTFDARPEDDLEKSLNLYKPDPKLRMGLADGFHSTLDAQGSGTCRTLIWAALRILAERPAGKGASAIDRPHLLLLDEPEICLHPDAIREARRVLYDLPATKNWQVMITTHSPVFIDLARDNTSIVRVERNSTGAVQGTTIFRPTRARLDDDDRAELKLLNLCDPYVAEFFFGGRTILVEGDTEYTAFKHVIGQYPGKYKNVHIVRARGKACLAALCKILNQFGKDYAILHDADSEEIVGRKTKKTRKNPAWAENVKLLETTETGRQAGRVRLVASVPDFERAFFDDEVDGDKPYYALARLRRDAVAFGKISELLDSLLEWEKSVPAGAKEWASIDDLSRVVKDFYAFRAPTA
jgi:putative ATP-dependent endonuclease of OLD family